MYCHKSSTAILVMVYAQTKVDLPTYQVRKMKKMHHGSHRFTVIIRMLIAFVHNDQEDANRSHQCFIKSSKDKIITHRF